MLLLVMDSDIRKIYIRIPRSKKEMRKKKCDNLPKNGLTEIRNLILTGGIECNKFCFK